MKLEDVFLKNKVYLGSEVKALIRDFNKSKKKCLNCKKLLPLSCYRRIDIHTGISDNTYAICNFCIEGKNARRKT